MKKNLSSFNLLLALVAILIISSCSDDDMDTCTFVLDPVCFCNENPTDPVCATVECTFDSDPVCFCNENPTDPKCNSSLILVITDFEGVVLDDVFVNETASGMPFENNASIDAQIVTGGAPQGDSYFSAEVTAKDDLGWQLIAPIFRAFDPPTDLSSYSNPHLNFYVKTNGPQFQFEAAVASTSLGGHGFAITFDETTDWQLVTINLADLGDLRWGDDINAAMQDVRRINLFLNKNFQLNGESVVVDIDYVHLTEGAPTDADVIATNTRAQKDPFLVLTDFEGVALDDVFVNETAPGMPFENNASIDAQIVTGDAPQGDSYFSAEVTAKDDLGWQLIAPIFRAFDPPTDLSSYSNPHLNFYVKTNGPQFQLEAAVASTSLGGHGFAVTFDETTEWQLVTINLTTLGDLRWGSNTIEEALKDVRRINLFLNKRFQLADESVVVDIDYIHFTEGPQVDANVTAANIE